MAEDLNTSAIIGRLVRDAELQYTTSGFAIGVFSLASNYRRKVGEDWVDEVNFIDVKLLGKKAEGLAQYLLKGKQVAVSGSIRQERWEQEGSKRSKIILLAHDVELLGTKGDNAASPQNPPQNSRQQEPEYF